MYLLPKPQQCVLGNGIFVIEYDRKIVIDPSCGQEVFTYAGMLKEELATCAGYGLDITRGSSKKTAVTLRVDKTLPDEAYRLQADEAGVTVEGGNDAGVLYGIQTLRQIIRQEGACIPYLSIYDFPDIPVRGLHYDVTRGRIPTVEYLKGLIDKMAFYKLNQLHLYIEHSFLFEDLTEVWRDDTPLTAEEILELDQYCRVRQIDLVPSLAGFGHLYKVLRTKSFRRLCELPETADEPFGFEDRMDHHTLDVSNEESLRFVKQRIEEYMPLFTSKYFNICSDETFDLGKGGSRELVERNGMERVYLDFVKKICEFVAEKGKIPMFWGDIVCKVPEAVLELPKGTVCLNWGYAPDESEETTRRFAEAGVVQYCCPGIAGWDQFVNRTEDAYENIRRMCSYAIKYGAAGVLNTEWGDCGHINHPDFGVPGIIFGAAFSWNHEIPSFAEIGRQIARIEYQDNSEQIVLLTAELAKHWEFNWHDLVNYRERQIAEFSAERLAKAEREQGELEALKRRLYQLLPCLDTAKRALAGPYFTAIEGMELVQEIGIRLANQSSRAGACALAGRLEDWFYRYKQVWRSVSRESELYRIQNTVFWYADLLRKNEKSN